MTLLTRAVSRYGQSTGQPNFWLGVVMGVGMALLLRGSYYPPPTPPNPNGQLVVEIKEKAVVDDMVRDIAAVAADIGDGVGGGGVVDSVDVDDGVGGVGGDVVFKGKEDAVDVEVHSYDTDDDPGLPEQDWPQRVRLLVWVKTSSSRLGLHAKAVKETWGRRVDNLLFISNVTNASFPAIGLDVSEGRNYDADLTIQGFRYIFQNHLQDADWFMQADDDTFLIVENLQYLLASEDPQEPVYLGLQPRHPSPLGNMDCLAGGYVLSRKSLRIFGQKLTMDETACQKNTDEDSKGQHSKEELLFARCLDQMGMELRPSEDALGRSRFHCLETEVYLQGKKSAQIRHLDYDPKLIEQRMLNMSDYSVTFHGLKAGKMYWVYYYVYRLAPYGRPFIPQQLNKG